MHIDLEKFFTEKGYTCDEKKDWIKRISLGESNTEKVRLTVRRVHYAFYCNAQYLDSDLGYIGTSTTLTYNRNFAVNFDTTMNRLFDALIKRVAEVINQQIQPKI